QDGARAGVHVAADDGEVLGVLLVVVLLVLVLVAALLGRRAAALALLGRGTRDGEERQREQRRPGVPQTSAGHHFTSPYTNSPSSMTACTRAAGSKGSSLQNTMLATL